MTRTTCSLLALGAALASPAAAQTLTFRLSADQSLTAEQAAGDPVPNFRSGVSVVGDGAIGGAARWQDDGYVAWRAPGNINAARGTLSFFWRAREPLGEAPFVIFRTGYADHSSWDMAFLRIDWNGHGFDAFVTDANLSRIRVSWTIPRRPDAAAWQHLAFTWDETRGIRLYVEGREVARAETPADLDAGLDQFGFAGRVIAPHQVQSRYNFMRGSDFDELRIYDAALDAAGIAALAAKGDPAPPPAPTTGDRTAWLHRYGWDTARPPLLTDPVTRVRKVEFADARDLKQWMWKGVDGIAETTWPGVYNRSALPGRHDYFELPDWNTYVEGGRTYDLAIPPNERINRIELRGAAYGTLAFSADGQRYTPLADRPRGVLRSVTAIAPRQGGRLRFTNRMAEQPIQELWAYDVTPGTVPAGSFQLSYTVNAAAAPTLAALGDLNAWIAGRFAPEERTTVVALPSTGIKAAVGAGSGAPTARAAASAAAAPIVHILIPSSFGDAPADQPLARAWDYGWHNLHDGLDGIAIDLPALKGDAPVPLNIKVHDPLWPGRELIDLSVSVPPGEARTLWLDLRDRILPAQSLALTLAAADPAFGPASIDGARIRLVFKPRDQALPEHVADRFNQVKDNWAFLVEEHTASQRAGLYRRLYADISDLLRVAPDHAGARAYWADINYRPENLPPVTLPPVAADTPAWAFRQLQDLSLSHRFVEWWIAERQVPYGDFGGGLSDDTDLVQQWPALALMGVAPDRINASLRALSDAVYRNGMIVNGLGAITTDELHAYEEGLNSNAARLYLNWGEPIAVERLMENTRGLSGVILPNAAGHHHFASNWYGGNRIYREGPWEWQKPYSFTVLHGPMLVGLFNGNAAARGLVTGVINGWLAHGRQGADGLWSYPNEINWRTDATRTGDGGGATVPLQGAWAAWRFTGDARYLRPVEARLAKAGASALAEFNEAPALIPGGAELLAKAGTGTGSSDIGRYARWQMSGDTTPLATLHAEAATEKMQRMDMLTVGHWWSDRVDMPTDLLQRERLGGVALKRNQSWPGNTVSWRFAEDGAAERVAILMPGATRTRFRVIAYNTTDRPQVATMTGWSIDAGRWTVQRATSPDDARTLVPDGPAATVPLERSLGTQVVFAPRTTTVYDFALAEPGTPVEDRADLGIGTDDVVANGRGIALTVHSLGARPVPGGEARLLAADGRVLATAVIPAMAAPTDLRPRTTRLRLPRRPGAATVEVALAGDAAEVTRLNNRVPLPQ
ncbi:LamG-like jellyroll fold domain-containing protein [Sphingomonas carotinifaciens]|uniref:Concanavalin A-like lectin/glucanases superfamily protein n=1 Tax=Sphingomonas carotinifaciens TaxID=1166323 RepID=A0A1G7QGZ7_9SPHN|nr:LamG-like jellyroll fold domain-containing protein [Sphingomonas carotinifaciens]MBB4087720.1 hypothetical protein [Sphingomonas carotinifaciens]MWC44915.1 LamG domain-containing protein [Sphingomonas carotinifaciens]SDF96890.1 Concanavalin A-like lectin/glucanases superfamily protein [Sphingomonas carotinifaciens]